MACAKTIILGVVGVIIFLCFVVYMLAFAPALAGFFGGLAVAGLFGVATGWSLGDRAAAEGGGRGQNR